MSLEPTDRTTVEDAKFGMGVTGKSVEGLSSSEADRAREIRAYHGSQLRKIALREIKRQRRALKRQKFVFRLGVLWSELRKKVGLFLFELAEKVLEFVLRVLLKCGKSRIDAHTEPPKRMSTP